MPQPIESTCLALWIPQWFELDIPLSVAKQQTFWLRPAQGDAEATDGKLGATHIICDELWQSRTSKQIDFANDIDSPAGSEAEKSDHGSAEHCETASRPRGCVATISSIRHKQLGEIAEVQTDGLDYMFLLADGRKILVNAEEQPGRAYELANAPENWQLLVILSDIRWQTGSA